jgi:nicotinamide-nucleotide amidase
MHLFPPDLLAQAKAVLRYCRAHGLTITTAESCTGGLIAALITEIPGSSEIFMRGVVTYANAAKIDMLGVPAALIATHGAVSEEVARAMAEGARRATQADIALAATGIAGPGGGSTEKPVGLVHLACATRTGTTHARHHFTGDRSAVRLQAAAAALAMVCASPFTR